MLTQFYDLDMRPGGPPLVVHVSQYDTDTRLCFDLFTSNGILDIPSEGTSGRIRGTKGDLRGIERDCELHISQGTRLAYVQMDIQLTAVSGDNVFELVLTKDGTTLPSANFVLRVERAALDTRTIQSDSQVHELDELLNRSGELIEALHVSETAQTHVQEMTERAERAAESATASEGNAKASEEGTSQCLAAAQTLVDHFSDTVAQKTAEAVESLQVDATEITDAAKTAIAQRQTEAETSVQNAGTAAAGYVDATKDAALEVMENKAREVDEIRIRAEETAGNALDTAGRALDVTSNFAGDLEEIQQKAAALDANLAGKADGAYVEDGYLYITSGGEIIAGPLGPFSGTGGGGGGGSSASASVLTVMNATGWNSQTIVEGTDVILTLNWSSLEDGDSTGDGTLTITVNGVQVANRSVAQGDVEVPVTEYIKKGTTTIKLRITDASGNFRTKSFSIVAIALSLASSFDDSRTYAGEIIFPYVPVGAVEKTIHFLLDGTEIGTVETAVSSRQLSFTVPAQAHGAHSLIVYFESMVNDQNIRSNTLRYDVIWLDPECMDPVISCAFDGSRVDQYSTVSIPYQVFDPATLEPTVVICLDGKIVSEGTADRNRHTLSMRFDEAGDHIITITSGTVEKEIQVHVASISVDIHAVPDDLVLYMSSRSRSNTQWNRDVWENHSESAVAARMTGFNWVSDGWQIDEDGISMLRVAGDARVTIPYMIFETDCRTTGKTIEIEFSTDQVQDYDAEIISCLSEGRGLRVTAQSCSLFSEQTSLGTQYKENEHVRVSFVIEPRSANRLVMVYVNGIMSGAVQYPDEDDFSQRIPVGISIGSSLCAVNLYCIRVYDHALTRYQIRDNWIADTQDGAEMVRRFHHNDVYDEYGRIVIDRLPDDLPYLVIDCPELPQFKGDKKVVSGRYTDPQHPEKSFSFEGAQANVQGTSSQYYPRKNYKISFKQGFRTKAGTVRAWAMRDHAVPAKTFCFKADVASSEGANNVELARLYNDACPYRTPAQISNPAIRQGVDGIPIVIFWYNTENGEAQFIGKYNFNNDKGTEDVFGFRDGDESWEIRNNTSGRVLFRSNDFDSDYTDPDTHKTTKAWLNDFEARFPDTDPPYTDGSQLKDLISWVMETDREKATNAPLDHPVTIGDTEYTEDTPGYRLARFRAEVGDRVELQSALFYYLFTELFLMVDSRAKNAFPSFMGSDIEET